ncbi:hypothetical protein AMTR_s00032p00223420 [Amborella trichopoda]|uniref:Uncharacterized protein n=1 Tax=Amborella trichopoda TaxID=13333 RepID=U5D3P7_AMBTC|nr:hypothetical protein AMTR_s00032p00223420 [Amborella trichopoda]
MDGATCLTNPPQEEKSWAPSIILALTHTVLALTFPLSVVVAATIPSSSQHSSHETTAFHPSKSVLLHMLIFSLGTGALLQLLVDCRCPTSSSSWTAARIRWAWLSIALFELCIWLNVSEATELPPPWHKGHLPVSAPISVWLFIGGLYQTTVFWSKAFVAPVLEDVFEKKLEGREGVWAGMAVVMAWWLFSAELMIAGSTRSSMVQVMSIVGAVRALKGILAMAKGLYEFRVPGTKLSRLWTVCEKGWGVAGDGMENQDCMESLYPLPSPRNIV